MFDVFDIIVAEITDARIAMVREDSAFGVPDDARLTWCNVAIARPTDPEPSRGVCGVAEAWDVYSLIHEARFAAEDDERWKRFVSAVEGWLSATSDWRIVFESECGQHPLDPVAMTSREFVERLDGHRRRPTSSFALIVLKR